jgi:hypothetical protein
MKNSLRISGGIGSSLVLALLPKCPMCMAAYLAMLTGLGVSVTIAAIIKTSLATLCVVILLWLLTTALLRLNCKRLKRFASGDCQSDINQKHHQTGEEENTMTSLKGKMNRLFGAESSDPDEFQYACQDRFACSPSRSVQGHRRYPQSHRGTTGKIASGAGANTASARAQDSG